jgi:modulator of FtsH protease HflC
MNRRVTAVIILAIVLLIVAYSATFFVYQSYNAVVVRFGKLVDVAENDPGLHWRIPFVDQVTYIDRRVINIDAPSFELLTRDQKFLVVSAYVRYQIIDPSKFYRVARTEQTAERRLVIALNETLRDQIGSSPLRDILSEKRAELMTNVTKVLAPAGDVFGIKVVDVRFKRMDFPQQNSENVYNRMRSQRAQEATRIRAEGAAKGQEIRAMADRDRTVLLAETQKQAQITRGEGDAEATRIYNEAFSRDPQFFDLYRSLQAMRTGLGGSNTTFVGPPKGEFFRFFEESQGAGAAPKPAGQQ